MAKYFGKVGYASLYEKTETVGSTTVGTGVWAEGITERDYFGDFNRNARRLSNPGKVNDDIAVSNEISIIADPYALDHFHKIRYATYMGVRWQVSNVEVQFPRLILILGGVYDGPAPASASDA